MTCLWKVAHHTAGLALLIYNKLYTVHSKINYPGRPLHQIIATRMCVCVSRGKDPYVSTVRMHGPRL
jgi:hypothetical protein